MNKYEITQLLEPYFLEAKAYYPELEHIEVELRVVKHLKKALMLAQPKLRYLFGKRNKRKYVIKVNYLMHLEEQTTPVTEFPPNVLLGWFGHEFGHILDYSHRSVWRLIAFGVGYVFSRRYNRIAEYAADNYAISKGLGPRIIDSKNFILNHTHIPETYKNKIKNQYMSPDEVFMKVQEIDDKIQEML